jgi:predicted transcriptional regulator
MSGAHELTDLQLALMRVLWTHGEATTADVHQALQDERPLAMTTVATILSRLEQKGVIARGSEERPYRYRACVAEQEVRRTMVGSLAERLFAGDVADMVSHLLGRDGVDAGDLERVRALIDAREKELEERHER